MPETLKVFLSYSHADESYKVRLDKHFSQMKKNKQIITWNDRMLTAGEKFDDKIAKEITDADVIIILISADFLDSSYCYKKELGTALKQQKCQKALAIGIIIGDCDWKTSPLKKFQLLPKDAKSLRSFPENQHDTIYMQIVDSVKEAIKKFQKQKDSEIIRNNSRKTGIKMILPVNKQVWINSDYFVTMSEFTHSLSMFLNRTDKIIAENVKEYIAYQGGLKSKTDLLIWDMMSLQIFLQQLCREINSAFFKYGGVRTHFRYLHLNKKKYLKLAAALDSTEYTDEMEAIPWTNSMIFASEKNRKSLLRSLNPEFHYGKKLEDSKFKDYITFTLINDAFCHNGHCLLSMGISFEEPNNYINLIYHLNYCQFELIIISIIEKFTNATKYDVVNTILCNQDNI